MKGNGVSLFYIKFEKKHSCCLRLYPNCLRAKDLIHTWLFGSSKCVEFRKIIFNCTIQITEEVKRCTSCSKQQESSVSSRSLIASHIWSYRKQFLATHVTRKPLCRVPGQRLRAARELLLLWRIKKGNGREFSSHYQLNDSQQCAFNHNVMHTLACWVFIALREAQAGNDCCGRRESNDFTARTLECVDQEKYTSEYASKHQCSVTVSSDFT